MCNKFVAFDFDRCDNYSLVLFVGKKFSRLKIHQNFKQPNFPHLRYSACYAFGEMPTKSVIIVVCAFLAEMCTYVQVRSDRVTFFDL